jgi:hypothetical protein
MSGSSRVTWLLLAAAALAIPLSVHAQPRPQDDIDRNLQERAARERAFGVRLEEARPVPPPPQPADASRSIVLPTPGTEILRREPLPPRIHGKPAVVPAAPVVNEQVLVDESQRRRLMELQTQTSVRPIDDPTRRPTLDVQQLQFEREQRATDLHSRILRNADSAGRVFP